jgi:hypothetical protein
MVEAIKSAQLARQLRIYPSADERLIKRHGERPGELWEVWGARELLTILVVALIFNVPEEFVPDQETADPATQNLPVKRRLRRRRFSLIQTQVRSVSFIPKEPETGAMNAVALLCPKSPPLVRLRLCRRM